MAIHAHALQLHNPGILISFDQVSRLLELRLGDIVVENNLIAVRHGVKWAAQTD